MHHIHISTGFLFVIALLVFGLVGLFVWYRVDQRRLRERREQPWKARLFADEQRARHPVYATAAPSTARPTAKVGRTPADAVYPPTYGVSNTYVVQDTSNDFLSGIVLGEMMARPTYVPGPTVYVPDTSACPPSPPASSGLDISWGSAPTDGGSSSCDAGGSDGGGSVD